MVSNIRIKDKVNVRVNFRTTFYSKTRMKEIGRLI